MNTYEQILKLKLKSIERDYENLRTQYVRMLHIAKKMHTWIFLNSGDEQKVYEELGLTQDENRVLGYLGKYELNTSDEIEISKE